VETNAAATLKRSSIESVALDLLTARIMALHPRAVTGATSCRFM
jgi:hypothetical protein